MNIMDPGTLDLHIHQWTSMHTQGKRDLDRLYTDLYAKLIEIEDAGNYNSDISALAQFAFQIEVQARSNLSTIEWSLEDLKDLQKSRTFRLMTKVRNRFKKH